MTATARFGGFFIVLQITKVIDKNKHERDNSPIAARHTPPSGDCPESREPVSLMVGKPEGSSNGWAANDLSQIGQQYLPPVARLTLESGNGAWGSVRAE